MKPRQELAEQRQEEEEQLLASKSSNEKESRAGATAGTPDASCRGCPLRHPKAARLLVPKKRARGASLAQDGALIAPLGKDPAPRAAQLRQEWPLLAFATQYCSDPPLNDRVEMDTPPTDPLLLQAGSVRVWGVWSTISLQTSTGGARGENRYWRPPTQEAIWLAVSTKKKIFLVSDLHCHLSGLRPTPPPGQRRPSPLSTQRSPHLLAL